jgi:hypothetical protein
MNLIHPQTNARQSTWLWLIALTLCAATALAVPALSHGAQIRQTSAP